MPEVTPSEIQTFASIKVVGVGGAGGSAINRMKDAGLSGVQFIAMNTDAQALHNSKADVKIHLGHHTTGGLGAGARGGPCRRRTLEILLREILVVLLEQRLEVGLEVFLPLFRDVEVNPLRDLSRAESRGAKSDGADEKGLR